MAIRDYFKKSSSKVKAAETENTAFNLQAPEVESAGLVEETSKQYSRFIPDIDFSSASNFARYGLAEEYYRDSFKRIYQQFPYDGSREEQLQFDNESTFLDKYVFDNVYPRTNGHAIFSANGWGAQSATSDGYALSDGLEYIVVEGSPHTSSGGMIGTSLKNSFGESSTRTNPSANKYDADIYSTEGVLADGRAGSRTSNLRLNPSDGTTLEFWMKKDQFIPKSTEREVIFDLWNGEASSSSDYGRMTLELTGSPDGTAPFLLTLQSGAWRPKTGTYDPPAGFFRQSIAGASVTTGSVANNTWIHYAVSMLSASTSTEVKFYVNGDLNNTTTLGTIGVNEITSGSMNAYIGALQTNPSSSALASISSMAGYGKLSGSIDEFRYWKTKRTSKSIGRNWFTNVGGGTNDYIANTELGVYFKFNEGVTGISSTDSVVLDYSGRISNGAWLGYTAGARSTESAIVESTAATSEYKDPIIYSYHPEVQNQLNRHIASGSEWDEKNISSLYYSYPSFMIEEEEGQDQKHLKNLV